MTINHNGGIWLSLRFLAWSGGGQSLLDLIEPVLSHFFGTLRAYLRDDFTCHSVLFCPLVLR
jgi:hypothetical protein